MGTLVPACIWRISPQLVEHLDTRFGEPLDAYVNGSQTWLRDDGPGGATLEWRLHPVAGFRQPDDVPSHHELFGAVAFALASGDEPLRPPEDLWGGLEAFPAYDDEMEPATLAAAVTDVLGLTPDAIGLVDHESVAQAWERSGGRLSILDALLEQLATNS